MFPASKFRRRLLYAAAFLLLFTLVGFFLLPVILKSQIEKRLSAQLGRTVTVEKVRVNPYTLALTLENFLIREADGSSRFVGWRRLYVNVDLLAPIWREWTVNQVVLEGFEASVAVKADASMNFSDILVRLAPPNAAPAPSAPEPAKSAPGRPVHVGRVSIIDARLAFSDASTRQPFHTALGPVTFALSNFRTLGAEGAPYSFEAVSDTGERFSWNGTLQAEPVKSGGRFSVENVALPKYAPYYAHATRADFSSGTVSVQGTYEISLEKDRRVLALRDGAVQVRNLTFEERATKQKAFELPSLDVTGIQADAVALKAAIHSVTLSGGQVHVRREKDGAINLLAMLQPDGPAQPSPSPTAVASPPSPSASPAPGAASPKPEVTLGELTLKGFRIEISDLAAPRPANLALSDVAVSLKSLTLADGAEMPVSVSAGWAPQGTLRIGGVVGISPVKADLAIDVAGLELLPVSPYLEQFVNARLTEGAVTMGLKLQASLPPGKGPVATVAGDIQVDKFGLVDGAQNGELAGFRGFALHGLRAGTSPELSIALDEVVVDAPYARAVMNADKTLNLAAIARTSPNAAASAPNPTPAPTVPPTSAPSTPASPPPKIDVAKVVIRDGDFRFTDRSVEPNVSTALNQFGGTISGLSSTNPAKADLALKGMVDGSGPVSIVGKVDPLGAAKFVDLKVDFKNVDLLPLSPYSGKFAGYELARGKLVLDVKAKVDGPAIEMANVITLNQFTFGSAVKSPDATSLPVRLGVALLKDLDGKIVIDVPVQGRTDDPSFKVGRVVLRVVVNLLTKAAVSPFALLGSAFGGGGDELAFQEFAPGSSTLNPAEIKKLETMTKALTNRPGLGVDLQGSYDAAADTFALRRVKLTELVRRTVWEEKRQTDPNLPPPDRLMVTPEESAATVKKLFEAKFPPGTEFGTPLPKPPEVVSPPPPPTGFFKRIVNVVTQKSRKEERAAAAENARLSAEHEKAVAAAKATGIPYEEMTGRLAETVTIDDNDLRALAQERARSVRDYFTSVGKIDPERLFLAKDKTDSAQAGKGPRVFLELQ